MWEREKVQAKPERLQDSERSPVRFEGRAARVTGIWGQDILVRDSLFFQRFPGECMEPTPEFKSILPESLVPVTEIDLAALSEIYDETDIYLSIYMKSASRAELDVSHSFVASRFKAMEKSLPADLREAFRSSISLVEEAIGSLPWKGERSRVIFACGPLSFLHLYRLGLEVEPLVVLDTSPFLLPLARLRDDYEDYGLLLLDSQESRLFTIRSHILQEEGHSSIDLMNKHKKGGWSQMRFNRLRKGAIKSFLGTVAEDVLGLEHLQNMRGLVIAGPGDAKSQLVEMLPLQMKDKVMGLLDVPMGTAPADLMKMSDQVALKKERSLSQKTADDLRSAVLKGQLSAYGTDQVRDALMQGRVNSLVLLDNFVIPGWICEKCQHFQEGGQPENCPHCGGKTSRVNVLEELYELAQRTGAQVEFVDEDEFLQSLGGVGAILRY
ncbi:MAG TPA: Vms1/Ankzf1 family peptidyl-tRNA hydrolase [Methanothrix sp.]|nr:Vms1/Ankzf1 family peptidyl-tRNA hydrolase [Methanothrix sp.]